MMAIVDADTGKVIATPAIGEGVDANAFDPDASYAFASNGEGTLTVVHEDSPDNFTVVENVATKKRARTMAPDRKTRREGHGNAAEMTCQLLPGLQTSL